LALAEVRFELPRELGAPREAEGPEGAGELVGGAPSVGSEAWVGVGCHRALDGV
jgi:hypothetical protein